MCALPVAGERGGAPNPNAAAPPVALILRTCPGVVSSTGTPRYYDQHPDLSPQKFVVCRGERVLEKSTRHVVAGDHSSYRCIVTRCGSFHLFEEVAYHCALDAHPGDSCDHIALHRVPASGWLDSDERWGLLVWTSAMAVPGSTP